MLAIVLFRTMHSLEQWSFGIFRFLDIYIAFSEAILSSRDYCFSSRFPLQKESETMRNKFDLKYQDVTTDLRSYISMANNLST